MTKRKLAFLSVGLGLVVVLLGGLWMAFLIAFLESDRIRPGSLTAWLVMDPAMRRIEPLAQCSPLEFSRQFLECGGICGESQFASFGTTLGLDELKARYDTDAIREEMGSDEVDLVLTPPPPGAAADCPLAVVRAYDNWDGLE